MQALQAQNEQLQEQLLDIDEEQRMKASRCRGKGRASPAQSQRESSSSGPPNSSASAPTTKSNDDSENKPDHIKRAASLGQLHCCFFRPWLGRMFVHSYFKSSLRRPEINYYNYHERYHSEQSEELAIIAEVWDSLHLDDVVRSFLEAGKDQKWIIDEV